jgi:hypothetical protein
VRRRVRHSTAPGLRPGRVPRRSRQAASVVGRSQPREAAHPAGGDEDKNLARVGSLARGKPILLRADTLRHAGQDRFGAPVPQVRERRPYNGCGHGRRGENPREVKTQERIGSNLPGNTWRLVARTLTWLNPLKTSPPRPVRGTRVDGCGRRHRVPLAVRGPQGGHRLPCGGPGCRFRGRFAEPAGEADRRVVRPGPGAAWTAPLFATTRPDLPDADAGPSVGMARHGCGSPVRPAGLSGGRRQPGSGYGRWQARHRRCVTDPCRGVRPAIGGLPPRRGVVRRKPVAGQRQEGQADREVWPATWEEQASEGEKPKGATGVKQSRKGGGRNKTSGG